MDNASPFTIAKNKKRPLYHLLSLTESASPRPAKKQKKAKSTSLSHSQSHPNKKKSKSKKAKLPKGDIKTSKMCIKFAKSILFKALSSIKQACTRSPSLEEETSLFKDIRFNDHEHSSKRQLMRDLPCLLLWWMSLLSDKKAPIALKNIAHRELQKWSDAKAIYHLFISLDHSDLFNVQINMFFQNNKKCWLGDLQSRPLQYKACLEDCKQIQQPYEEAYDTYYDASTGFAGVPLLRGECYTASERDVIKEKAITRYIQCVDGRFTKIEYIENTTHIDPHNWAKQDTSNEFLENQFIYNFGKEGIEYYVNTYFKDLKMNACLRGFIEHKRYYLGLNLKHSSDKMEFRDCFKKTLKNSKKNDTALRNFGGDYAQLLHRINAHLTDAMIVESGNAKLNILYGVNRNFGITGINEAGQICINGPMLSEFDPRPTVNSILAGQYKPRKKCNISKWKQQPYNIGIFAESNDHNNKRRSQYRKSIETVLIPGKDTTQKVKIESVKSVIKQRDRKKAEAHARAKAKAEATKAAAEAARAKEEDAKADDDEDVKAADESIESSDSGSSDDDIPIDAPKRKLKYASSSESESSSSYESESD
eukprot:212446_1